MSKLKLFLLFLAGLAISPSVFAAISYVNTGGNQWSYTNDRGRSYVFAKADKFSAEMWIKTTDIAATWIGTRATSTPFAGWVFGEGCQTNNRMCLALKGNSGGTNEVRVSCTNDNSENDGNWHHVGFTYTGSDSCAGVTLYIDGTACAMTCDVNLTGGTMNATGRFEIAGERNNQNLSTSTIDEVRIWRYPRTAAQIKANQFFRVTDEENLIGYWRMDEPADNAKATISVYKSTAHPSSSNLTNTTTPTRAASAPITYPE